MKKDRKQRIEQKKNGSSCVIFCRKTIAIRKKNEKKKIVDNDNRHTKRVHFIPNHFFLFRSFIFLRHSLSYSVEQSNNNAIAWFLYSK